MKHTIKKEKKKRRKFRLWGVVWTKNERIQFYCPSDWIQIRIHQILWIRIRIQSIRIHITQNKGRGREEMIEMNDKCLIFRIRPFLHLLNLDPDYLYLDTSTLTRRRRTPSGPIWWAAEPRWDFFGFLGAWHSYSYSIDKNIIPIENTYVWN